MKFDEFDRFARSVFDDIPGDFRAGVAGLDVERRTVPHPELPEIYTLGECLSDFYPSDFGGAGDVQSRVVLYYGSFLELARRDEEFDWEGEIFETVTHEVRHHLEHLASDDALEVLDYVEDQNFSRREGEPFDPFFFESGRALEGGWFEVDGDRFLRMPAGREASARGSEIEVPGIAPALRVRVPPLEDDVTYLRLPEGTGGLDDGDVYLVLVRGRGWRGWLVALASGGRLSVGEVEAERTVDEDVGE